MVIAPGEREIPQAGLWETQSPSSPMFSCYIHIEQWSQGAKKIIKMG